MVAARLLGLLRKPRLLGWTLLTLVASPYLIAHKVLRCLKGKRSELDIGRWWPASKIERTGPVVVMFGNGIGEFVTLEPFSRSLSRRRPDLHIVWAIRDPRSRALARASYPDREIVGWPFEFFVPIYRFLDALRPRALVYFEKPWHPVMLECAPAYGADVVCVNAKVMQRPKRTGGLLRKYYSWMLGRYSLLCFATDEMLMECDKRADTYARKSVTGNMKTAVPPTTKAKPGFEEWLRPADGRILLCAGSTHEGEEAIVLEAFCLVRGLADCDLILAPRHSARIADVEQLVRSHGYQCSLRTNPSGASDVYLMDAFGELNACYAKSVGAFVGGTFVADGHNVMEPALLGVPVSYGPIRGSNRDLQVSCEDAGVGFRVTSARELAEQWLKCATDEAFREEIRARCQRLIDADNAIERVVDEIEQLVGSQSQVGSACGNGARVR